MTTSRLKMPLITESQAQKHITHNEALQMLDVFVNGSLKSITVTTPPGSPTEGDAYFIPGGGSGDWAAYVGYIAHWFNFQWYFYEVPTNIILYIEDDAAPKRYDGTTWNVEGSGGKVYVDASGGNATLTAQQSSADVIQIGGSGSALTLTLDALEKTWTILNDSSANVTVSTGAGGTVFVEAGFQANVVGDGTGIRPAFTIAPDGLKVGNVLNPPLYSTSSTPSASSNYGAVIFVTDGDAGSPCLAVSDGGTWKRIALGATIASV